MPEWDLQPGWHRHKSAFTTRVPQGIASPIAAAHMGVCVRVLVKGYHALAVRGSSGETNVLVCAAGTERVGRAACAGCRCASCTDAGAKPSSSVRMAGSCATDQCSAVKACL